MESLKRGTPRYRKVGGSSQVDESLFIKDKKFTGSNKFSSNSVALIPAHATVLTKHELEKIRAEAIIKSEAELLEERQRALDLKEDRERKARERKQRMIQLEEQAKLHTRKSDIEIEQETRAELIRKQAQDKIDAENDLQKMLNTLAARAVAFSIRDQQVQDKRRLEHDQEEYERQMDLVMELDRLKDLQRREEEENSKRWKRVEDRKVIVEQMEERHRAKLLAAEAREQENLTMRALMKKYEDEDKVMQVKRQKEVERSRLEVIAANSEAISRKKEAKQQEKSEVEEILRYQALKDAELAKREEDEKMLEKQKKERQAKLLAMQERSQNKQAEMDELRARRAAEAREREARRKEKEEAEKRRIEMGRLQDDRHKQAENKRQQEESQRFQEETLFKNTLAYTELRALEEQKETLRKRDEAKAHRDFLLKQIEESEGQRKRDRSVKFEEGSKLREAEIREMTKLNVMKEQMIKSLESKGIDPVYLAEMKALDVTKIAKR